VNELLINASIYCQLMMIMVREVKRKKERKKERNFISCNVRKRGESGMRVREQMMPSQHEQKRKTI